MNQYILALDQGTSSSRAILFDTHGTPVASAQHEFPQIFPSPGLVEQAPEDIWGSQAAVMREVLEQNPDKRPSAIGISNQRETVVVWDAADGQPVYNAIVWQDRRTAAFCAELKARGLEEQIRQKTGLVADPYFSAAKIKWILDNVPGARERADAGNLRFGTVDSWLLWKLSKGRIHATDVSNASRTMLFNIHTLEWDSELLELFGIPASMLPEVRPSAEIYGTVSLPGGGEVPVSGMAGDQQAALFGQLCFSPGEVKNTYGTGCFLLMNTGQRPVLSKNNLLTTVAWKIGSDAAEYALEGSVFVAGSVVQWLRDSLGIIRDSAEVESLALSVPDNGGVYFVPALTGLGAPYWVPDVRGSISGISRGTTAGHIARAALEGIAYEVMDVVHAMEKDSSIKLSSLKVDGGASRNNLLMQFQSDILSCEVVRPVVTETTAFGAACLAGIGAGIWSGKDEILSLMRGSAGCFRPSAPAGQVDALIAGWRRAISALN